LLPLIEKGAHDERNFVKKGVNWALRAIGRRNRALNAAALAVSKRLASSDEAACRWVGKDALRELGSPKVRAQLARRAR
jgi:3-methyladenine DNA glycosylase AlkD